MTESQITVVFDDILQQDVDAIVNPANRHMIHGGGLAASIAIANPDLVRESSDQAPIKTGEAILTSAGTLPFKGVIHAVGPVWEEQDGAPHWRKNDPAEDPDELLRQAHLSAIERAAEAGYTSVAFPAISCGLFRFPVKRAASIAIRAIREAQAKHPEIEVVFCLLNDDHYNAFTEALNLF